MPEDEVLLMRVFVSVPNPYRSVSVNSKVTSHEYEYPEEIDYGDVSVED